MWVTREPLLPIQRLDRISSSNIPTEYFLLKAGILNLYHQDALNALPFKVVSSRLKS